MHNPEDKTESASLRTEEPTVAGDFCTCFDGSTGEGVSKCNSFYIIDQKNPIAPFGGW